MPMLTLTPMLILEGALWLALAFALYIYFGYPAILWACSRVLDRPVHRADVYPYVSFIVAVHNEEAQIREKIENTLDADYPEDRMEILIASDGSTDGTNEVVREWEHREERLRLLALPRGGKALALNEAVARAKGEVLVFSDANAMLEPGSLRALVSSFADPDIGGVCGNQKYRTRRGSDSTEQGEGLYWRFDKWLKSLESRSGSIFAADGSLYAIRKGLYVPIGDPSQADDIAISTRVVLQGRRLVYEPAAVTYEDAPEEGRREFARKVRVSNHSVHALLKLGRALWSSGFYSFELLSHKLFRHLVPFALIALLVTNLLLVETRLIYTLGLALQLAFYALAVLGFALRGSPVGRRKLLSIPYFFSLANLAALFGVTALVGGRRIVTWRPRGGGEASP